MTEKISAVTYVQGKDRSPSFSVSSRQFYSCVLSYQAFEWGWRRPCCDRDQYLVCMIKKKFTFEKQQHLYYNKVTVSLTPVERLGNQATNCPIDYSFSENHVIGLFAVVCCWIQNYLCVLVMYPFTSYNYRIRQHSVWKLLTNFILKIG